MSTSSLRHSLAALAVAGAALAAAPSIASADATWFHDSQYKQQSTGSLVCGTGERAGDGNSDLIHVVGPEIDYAQVYLDPAAPPAVGDTAYVSVTEYAVSDSCLDGDGGTRATLELKLPAGAEIDGATPFLCGFGRQDALQCPIVVQPGRDGGQLLMDGRSGDAEDWAAPDNREPFRLLVPLKLTRPFNSLQTTPERFCGGFCPEESVPGRVQFLVRFKAGTNAVWSDPLLTSVGLKTGAPKVEPGPPATGSGPAPGSGGTAAPPATHVLAGSLPRRIGRRALRRGLRVTLNAPAAGARLKVRLAAGGRTLATASRRAAAAGPVTLRLRPAAKALHHLGRRLRVTGTVTAPGASTSTSESRTLKLGR
ncbi:MAG TPA: hypothetical protein VF533_02085 [Solirubrobacteraceae bacterium]